MKKAFVWGALASMLLAGSVQAAEMPTLARKHQCNTCHAIDKKVVGPAWQDVADKYKGQADAEAKLVVKVSKGGSGNWGSMPMPPNDPNGSKQGDITELVRFILKLAH